MSHAKDLKVNEPPWEWQPTENFLKFEKNGTSFFWNLTPSITLINKTASGDEPEIVTQIEQEKNFLFSDENGWHWHKSWNLPNIAVHLEIQDKITGESLYPPKGLHAQIFAVKPELDNDDNSQLVDVGLRGETKIELRENRMLFPPTKFASTSFNNEGIKFHLVVCVFVENMDDTLPLILFSRMSPPIFVDSRKTVRDMGKIKSILSIYEPFNPEILARTFYKRKCKNSAAKEIEIKSDIESLVNYFTAPNIRQKVKHPVFLALRFSEVIELYYNPLLVNKSGAIDGKFVEELQEILNKSESSTKKMPRRMLVNKRTSAPGNINSYDECRFLVFVKIGRDCDAKVKKNIRMIFTGFDSRWIEVIYEQEKLPRTFVHVGDVDTLAEAYRKVFPRIKNRGTNERQNVSSLCVVEKRTVGGKSNKSAHAAKESLRAAPKVEDYEPGMTKKAKFGEPDEDVTTGLVSTNQNEDMMYNREYRAQRPNSTMAYRQTSQMMSSPAQDQRKAYAMNTFEHMEPEEMPEMDINARKDRILRDLMKNLNEYRTVVTENSIQNKLIDLVLQLVQMDNPSLVANPPPAPMQQQQAQVAIQQRQPVQQQQQIIPNQSGNVMTNSIPPQQQGSQSMQSNLAFQPIDRMPKNVPQIQQQTAQVDNQMRNMRQPASAGMSPAPGYPQDMSTIMRNQQQGNPVANQQGAGNYPNMFPNFGGQPNVAQGQQTGGIPPQYLMQGGGNQQQPRGGQPQPAYNQANQFGGNLYPMNAGNNQFPSAPGFYGQQGQPNSQNQLNLNDPTLRSFLMSKLNMPPSGAMQQGSILTPQNTLPGQGAPQGFAMVGQQRPNGGFVRHHPTPNSHQEVVGGTIVKQEKQ